MKSDVLCVCVRSVVCVRLDDRRLMTVEEKRQDCKSWKQETGHALPEEGLSHHDVAFVLLCVCICVDAFVCCCCCCHCYCRDCANSYLVRLLTYLLFGCRQAAVGLIAWGRVGRALAWPLRVAASMLQRPLNKVGWLVLG